MPENEAWRTDPISSIPISKTTARRLLEIPRLLVVTLTDDGRKLLVRVIESTDALPTLKGLDDVEEILLYVGPSEGKLPDVLQKALTESP